MNTKGRILGLVFILSLHFGMADVMAANRVVNLEVGYKKVNVTGEVRKAIVVNNQMPAPTLHFQEGDHITINVYNKLDKETTIHWHGILLPWQMDGVSGVTQKGIPPQGVFQYKFTLHQSGTYWYHAHSGVEEQQGLYGAFIVEPKFSLPKKYNQDFVAVLSDWSNTYPEQILANLKKDGEYYSPRFPLQPSLVKFIHDYRHASRTEREDLVADYKMMQQMRMSLYDLSDVAYDAFLLNGQPNARPWQRLVKVGDVVRLRFIGAMGATIFHVKIPHTTMQIINIDGNNVKPLTVNDFSIAPGETYDVLVKIEKNQPYIIYAESQDTSGAAVGALVTSTDMKVNYNKVAPFPEPPPVTREMMAMMMGGMKHPAMHGMEMEMPTEPSVIGDAISPPSDDKNMSAGTKYEKVIAAVKTNNPDKPITGVIKMELFGYMDRYVWFINGIAEEKAQPIVLQPGKRYRFVFTNTSMMHHPMHIHGHWFILRNGNGAFDPLLHTIDVPPGATITADVDTDASGQWIFHCHFLYHMAGGMSRTLQYSTLLEIVKGEAKPQDIVAATPYHNRPIVRVDEVRPIDKAMVMHPMAHPHHWWYATLLDVGVNPVTKVQKITYKGLYGSDYNKLELFINSAQVEEGKVKNADLDIFYWRPLYQFWSIKGGANYFYRPSAAPYWQPGVGVEGLTPYFIDTDIRAYYHGGSAKFDVELFRDTQITNNFFMRLEVRSILATKTLTNETIGSGLNKMEYTLRPYYRLMPGLNMFAEFVHEKYYGAFRDIEVSNGDGSTENTLTFGLSALF